MEFFDVRTGYLLVGALYFFVPIVTWVALKHERGLSAVLWCVGGTLLGIGSVLASLRGIAPDWVALSMANLILLASMMMRIDALDLLRDQPGREKQYLIILSLLFALHEYVGYPEAGGFLFPIGMLTHAILDARIAYLAYRIGREHQAHSAYWIAGNYLIVVVVLLALIERIVSIGPSISFLQSSWQGVLLVFVGAMTTVTNYMGYVGLVLDRVKKRELEAVAHVTRQEESLRLSTQIAQLQRQQMVGEMSAYFAHEVRQPLTALISTAQLASRGLSTARMDSLEVTTLIASRYTHLVG